MFYTNMIWLWFIIIIPLKHLTIKYFLHTKKGPQNKKKLDTKKSGKTCMKTTSENIYSVFEGWITLHNKTYKNEFVRALDGKSFMPWKIPSFRRFFFFFWVSNAFSDTLTSVLTLVKMALSGVPIVDLERHSWVPQQEPLTRVPWSSPIHNILFMCFLLAHCDQLSVLVYHH
jgi:hypothetical protein